MATLDALAIRGIRSFDPQKMERINFAKPGVTVIVGHNGSGKTTIVECLKYATTGDQPPNTKGGAFVHDPKMANEKEVKAQVKLRFYARNGLRMTATRNLQVTAKKTGALTMKTLESLLDTENTKGGNKRTTISTRCAEIDAEIPNLLGVSKSVLENVIFCHQEDSYWPLAEPSVLKKKFDDIFEATKYTKALDNIKVIRKERAADLKADNERLNGLSAERKHAEKLNQKIADVTRAVDEKETQVEALQDEETVTSNENRLFYDQGMRFREFYLKSEELEKRIKTDRGDARQLETALGKEKAPLSKSSVSDESLQAQVDAFRTNAMSRETEVSAGKKELDEEKLQQQKLEGRLKAVDSERVLLKGDAQRYAEDLKVRQSMVYDAAIANEIGSPSSQNLDAEAIEDLLQNIRLAQKRQADEADEAQKSIVDAMGEFSQKLADKRSAISAATQARESTETRIRQLTDSIGQAEPNVDKNKGLESEIRFVTADLVDRRKRIETLTSDFASARYDDTIAQKAKNVQAAELERQSLFDEQSATNHLANDRAKLDFKLGELKTKQAIVGRILETHNGKFQTYFSVDAQPESMESDVEQLISVKSRELSRVEMEHTKANRESAEAHQSAERLKHDLDSKGKEIKKLEKTLHAAANVNTEAGMTPVTLDTAIADAKIEIAALQEEVSRVAGAGEFFKKLLEDGKKSKKCGACDRRLMSTKEIEAFEATLQAKIAQTTDEKVAESQEGLAGWARELSRLQEYLPMQASLSNLRDEGPNLEKSSLEMQKKDDVASAAAEKAGVALKEMKATLSDLSALREQAKNVSRVNKEINIIRGEIGELEQSLQSSGSSRPAADIQSAVDKIAQTLKELAREQQQIRNSKEQALSAQRTVEKEIHTLQLKARALEAELQAGRVLEQRMVEEKKEVEELRLRLPQFSLTMTSLQSDIQALKAERKDVERTLNERAGVSTEKLKKLNASIVELDSIQSRIDRYVKENRAGKLKLCTQQVQDIESQIAQIKTSIEAKRAEVSKGEKELAQGDGQLSHLQNNLQLRRLKKRIEETEVELGSLPMDEAAASRATFDVKWEAMSRRERDLKAKIARLLGEASTMKAQIDSYKKDLSTDFKNINKRYMDQLVKVKMSDMANSDLEKYAKALDNAIMKYHSLKMEEVNDIMRHLWNKTYQGTDIDGIAIRSEGETGVSKRSYNYRVVMSKDQVEMDMRGRCSAGQKMLASIIIRLALSDSFAQDCGILALDEPTNALDVENIEALAASLVEIINERRRAANFQLIIITHDENFLRKMGESGVIQDYWRVTRSDSQKSIIEKHMLL